VSVQPFLLGDGWVELRDGDPSLMDIFRRHYSYKPPTDGRRKKSLAIGPGFKLVLMTADGGAICTWRVEKHRLDGQAGANCSIFRREHGEAASTLLRAAMARAWTRWPLLRLFTFVDPRSVKPTLMRGRPTWGHCFYQAGWRFAGLTQRGLHILECESPAVRAARIYQTGGAA
jgi:hypothetical protein